MYKKSKLKLISDAVCGVITLLSILIYILIGVFAHTWHPTWVIILISEFVCAIMTIIVNTYNKIKEIKSKKTKKQK